jgi:hypothetical protein
MARIEPHVLFPVMWPAELNGTRDVVSWVLEMTQTHYPYLAALAEIGRRNGGGGYVLVNRSRSETGDDVPLSLPVDGKQFTTTTHVARWVRGMADVQSLVGRNASHRRKLTRPPTQTDFTMAVVMDKDTAGGVFLVTLRAGDGTMLAHHLATLERGGLDEHTAVVAAMDGGTGTGATLVVS